MPSLPSGRRRWTGFSNRRARAGERGGGTNNGEPSSASSVAARDRDAQHTALESRVDIPSELAEMQARRLLALERQREEAERRPAQVQQNNVDQGDRAVSMTDIPLNDDEEDSMETGQSQNSKYLTSGRTRSPSPFHGLLDLGRANGMASSTFLEDSSRHRPEFRDPDLDERENDSDYDILMHSEIWSEAGAAVRRRAQRSRFRPPFRPPFRNIRTEVQEDNRPTPLSFEDFETLHVPSDPSPPSSPVSEPWDGWFFSDTPQETYAFEVKFPNAAPLLRKIIALPHNRKVALMTAAAAVTWKELAAGLDKAVRMGRLVVDGVALNARDLREVAEERVLDWAPGLFEAMWNLATGPFLLAD